MRLTGSNRFIAVAALRGSALLRGKNLAAAIGETSGTGARVLQDMALTHRVPNLLLTVGDTPVSVMAFDSPPLNQSPDGRDMLLDASSYQPHAHLVVGSILSHDDHASAVKSAAAVMQTLAGLTRVASVTGVRWSNSGAVLAGSRIAERTEGLSTRRPLTDLWVRVIWRETGPNGASVGFTRGLSAFVGRELELGPSTAPIADLTRRLRGTVQYLLSQGPVLNDGDQLAMVRNESIRVELADHGQFVAGPILRLAPERMILGVA